MFIYRTERQHSCPRFKSVSIQAETEIAGKSDEEGILPIMIAMLKALRYQAGFLFQTFRLPKLSAKNGR